MGMAEEDPFAKVPDRNPLRTKARALEAAYKAFGFECSVNFDSDNELHVVMKIPHSGWYAGMLTDGRVDFALLPKER